MRLRIRSLQLRAMTADGLFGTHFNFEGGLVIVRADNSSGKSTCMQAIIYALGLEGMLGASQEVPLPHAMTSYLEHDGKKHRVLSSSVFVEVENQEGIVITCERAAKDDVKSPNLITVAEAPLLTGGPSGVPSRPFYVRQSGAASRPDGFHYFLARFLGWVLPTVTRYDGKESPLYMEVIFPLMFVEQKHGWAGVQARMPTHLRIREPAKRATEFVLGLQATDALVRSHSLHARAEELRASWVATREELAKAGTQRDGILQNVPTQPPLDWPSAAEPQMLFPYGETWRNLTEEVAHVRQTFDAAKKHGIPTVKAARPALEARLNTAEQALSRGEHTGLRLVRELEREEQQLRSTQERLAALREDLRRNQDAAKLQKMGAVLPQGFLTDCPSCHRPLADSLLPATTKFNAMSVEDNVEFLKEQIATFEALEGESRRLVMAHNARVSVTRETNSNLRSDIRSIKKSLSADERMPSVEAIERLVRLERTVEDTNRLRDQFASGVERLTAIVKEHRAVVAERKEIESGLTPSDVERIEKLESSFRAQLREYDFSSVGIDTISISMDSYRPTHEGFDLGFDLSASDMVRTIWAYLLGLVEVARTEETNHLGLLILDEPRQQETKQVSFAGLLKRASLALAANQQIIFATSEEPATLKTMLKDIPHSLHLVEGQILKPMSDDERARRE